jgi:hypothetical protein
MSHATLVVYWKVWRGEELRIHVNITYLFNITCILVSIGVILKRFECILET